MKRIMKILGWLAIFIGLSIAGALIIVHSPIKKYLRQACCSSVKDIPRKLTAEEIQKQLAAHPQCTFCKIIAHELPATVIKETDDVIVIEDKEPRTPMHYLIIPKKHIADVRSLGEGDKALAGDLLFMAKDLSKNLPGSQAFRLISNNGSDVGQTIFHMHIHFLAGKKLEPGMMMLGRHE
jgi:histidine triad (HIT) family protein